MLIQLKNNSNVNLDVIESGSSQWGNYQKYEDGTLIQWGKMEVTQAIQTANGSTGFYRTANPTYSEYAIPFLDGSTPSLVLTPQSAINLTYINNYDSNMFVFYALSSYSSPSATRYVNWVAIGKWK